MCLNCLHCNVDKHDPSVRSKFVCGCQGFSGRSTNPLGRFGGLAEALAFANELQGDGTLHGHGFIALANAYQYGSLQDIVDLIEENVAQLQPAEVITRLIEFIPHVSREGHFDDDKHQNSWASLEEQFRHGTTTKDPKKTSS